MKSSRSGLYYLSINSFRFLLLFLLLSILCIYTNEASSKLYFPLNLTCNYQASAIRNSTLLYLCFSPVPLNHFIPVTVPSHTTCQTLLKTETKSPSPQGILFCAPCPHHLSRPPALSTIQNTSFKTAFSKLGLLLELPTLDKTWTIILS